jgi:hypothetical protein
MNSQGRSRSSRTLFAVMTFAVLCAGVLFVSQETQSSSVSEERPESCPWETTRLAFEDAARADLALRENNFGAAQVHIQRARVRLEAAMAEENESGE